MLWRGRRSLALLAPLFAVIGLTMAVSQAAAAGLPCRLTAADYTSLAASPSKLTPAKAAAETPRHKQIICQTRALYHRIMRQHGKLNHFEHFAADYLTAAEYRIVNKVVNDYIIRKLSAH